MITQRDPTAVGLEQKMDELMRRVADLERRILALERGSAVSGDPAPRAPAQNAPVKIEHNYLRRAIATARREYERK